MRLEGFIGQSYVAQSKIAAGDQCINLYPEVIGPGHGKNVAALWKVPGKRLFCGLDDHPLRMLYAGDNRLFAAAGTTLYEISATGTATPLNKGTYPVVPLELGTTPVTAVAANDQLFVVSTTKGYMHNGVRLAPILDTTGDVIAMVMAAFQDNYFIGLIQNSQNFIISSLPPYGAGGPTWDPLDIGAKEGGPDKLAAILSSNDELNLFGYQTTEIWSDTGASNFPFERNQNAFIEQGIAAPFSAAKGNNARFWLGETSRGAGYVWMAQGYVPIRISTPAIENTIQSYTAAGITISDAVGFCYEERGHEFYVLNFPTADATWVFDSTIGMWHQRGRWDDARAVFHQDRARYHAYVFGQHFVGGGDGTGNIYLQDQKYLDDAGVDLRWLRSTPHVCSEQDWIRYAQLQIDMQVGVAASSLVDLHEPRVMLRVSDDGGQTWGNERIASSGKVGEYKRRVLWRQLGRSRDRVFEISGTSPIQIALVDAYLKLAGAQ